MTNALRMMWLVLVLVGPTLGGCNSPLQPPGVPDGGCNAAGHPVSWQMSTVSLTACDFSLIADGQTYTSNSSVDIHSDPGDPTYTTLELIWTEHAREMRYFIYFTADATRWWSNEMRTYNGQNPGDWLYYEGTFAPSRIGSAFQGDLDLTNQSSDTIRGELHLHGLVLSTSLTGPPDAGSI